MRILSYMPSFRDWVLEVHRDRAKEISMCLGDPVVANLVWDHYWNEYLEAVAGIRGSLFLIETMLPGEGEPGSDISHADFILGRHGKPKG